MDLTRPLRLEWRLVLGRWLAIAFVAVGLRVYALSVEAQVAAYAVLLVGLLYSVFLLQLIRKHHPAAIAGVVPTLGDAVLCTLMFPIVGGFETPFYTVLYLVVLSVAIRFGLKSGLEVAGLIAAMDAVTMLFGGSEPGAAYTLRTGVIFGTVLITSFLHEEARQTEATLAERLQQAEALNAALEHQSLHDALTTLPNRVLLRKQLEQAVANAQASGQPGALLLFDLDRFKVVNDSLGHPAGDALLREMARRLAFTVGAAHFVARLGGDEFAVLSPAMDRQDAQLFATRLSQVLQQPVSVAGQTMRLRASIGVVLFPEHGYDPDVLLRRVDVAMYLAKQSGGEFEVYDAARDDSASRLAVARELRDAIDTGQLVLHYQPKLDLREHRVVGVEALVRWHHPERGLIGPDQFVPLAEETGLIEQLSRRVIALALQQSRVWQSRGLHLPIAINLSARDLSNPSLPDWIARQLLEYGVDANDIDVEVTETMLIGDPDQAIANLTALRRIGVQSAIDDFGTGYSSLGYLQRLPVSMVKIDRCFLRQVRGDDGDFAIVAAAIDLSHRLGLTVLAEGVEDEATLQLLEELGCDQAQGYVIGRPQSAADLEVSMRSWTLDADPQVELAA